MIYLTGCFIMFIICLIVYLTTDKSDNSNFYKGSFFMILAGWFGLAYILGNLIAKHCINNKKNDI